MAEIEERVRQYWLCLYLETNKVSSFLSYKISDLAKKWIILRYNAYMMQQRMPNTALRKMLQQSMLKFYKEICLLLEFISVNQQATQRLINKMEVYNGNIEHSQLPRLDINMKRKITQKMAHLDPTKLLTLKK